MSALANTTVSTKEFRLIEFNIRDTVPRGADCDDEEDADADDTNGPPKKRTPFGDKTSFVVQMFGINETGETACINATGFLPFFYVMVDDSWGKSEKEQFMQKLRDHMGKYYANSIDESKFVQKKKLYGFDGGKHHKFLFISFKSVMAMNRAQKLWFEKHTNPHTGRSESRLIRGGYVIHGSAKQKWATTLYEANIPPMLRMFHIEEISPSGWIRLPGKGQSGCTVVKSDVQNSICKYEYMVDFSKITPLPHKETPVPYKICSFDIEASSSHGDFPLPKKTYTKLACDLLDVWANLGMDSGMTAFEFLEEAVGTAFGFGDIPGIDSVFLKLKKNGKPMVLTETDVTARYKRFIARGRGHGTPVGLLMDDGGMTREDRYIRLTAHLNRTFPPVTGDRVTFIGSTFMRYGDSKPYMNHCIVAGGCDDIPATTVGDDGAAIPNILERYVHKNVEKEESAVLLAWKELIQREDPDIIIGYNIFGFDYTFMFDRAKELNCIDEFLKMSRADREEICSPPPKWNGGEPDNKPLPADDAGDGDGADDMGGGAGGDIDSGDESVDSDDSASKSKVRNLSSTKIVIASGQHDLTYIRMPGRLQVDLFNHFRREENLASYKLDNVASHFIGDKVKSLEHFEETDEVGETVDRTVVHSKNLIGLDVGSFVKFEETTHTVNQYRDGEKFEVVELDLAESTFEVIGCAEPNMNTSVRWGIAKDDVTPKDIFRLTNGSSADRAIIAKYCIQDCNLVHYLLNKVDIITSFVEMSNLCSVPMDFLVLRGQGIKLQSYVAKKCREKDTLIPVLERKFGAGGYEGAIVLQPRTGIYLDRPVFCVDYSSLYPSSIISENLSHDSKVWTKEFDLNKNLVRVEGERDEEGNMIYDNLDGYRYVEVKYETYEYIRKTPSAAPVKTPVGFKICRFAQLTDGTSAVLPAILKELLQARKDTRKKIKTEPDAFMRSVLDKRQLSIKVTANSIYGQTGASTSKFYEPDIAASTTAIGRLLLTYAERLIGEIYGNRICDVDVPESKHRQVRTRCQIVYGDTDSVFATFCLETVDGMKIIGKEALAITIYLAQEVERISSKFLKAPHTLEYEKVFLPFVLLSKKRYVGMLHEHDVNSSYRKSMGLVLARRDNAGIVKDLYGGAVDIIMNDRDVSKAFEFVRGEIMKLVNGEADFKKLIITKSLRGFYKNPRQIAHKVLADRIAVRQPGSEPKAGNRMEFIYVVNANKKALQGDRIETPEYIREQGLAIDYGHYISNQLMKPLCQLFALALEELPGFERKKQRFANVIKTIEATMDDPDKRRIKIDTLRGREVETLLFGDALRLSNNRKSNSRAITDFF